MLRLAGDAFRKRSEKVAKKHAKKVSRLQTRRTRVKSATKPAIGRSKKIAVRASASGGRKVVSRREASSVRPTIDFAKIPAGAFKMGSPKKEFGRSSNEDQVKVRITNPFAISLTVVTQAQWVAVMGTKPWGDGRIDAEQCGDRFPAVYVSWADAVLFCEKLTKLERAAGRLALSQTCRLPTEAEWEYACRAGTTTAYSFGNDPEKLKDYGWYNENSGDKHHPVAGKKPNPWGLFDVHGNVWEWCLDWYADMLTSGDDPKGPRRGTYRVARGGMWSLVSTVCRSAVRMGFVSDYCYCGFRVVCVGGGSRAKG
jgi:formylglycine-generating enzyme required for sulfatase activity